MFDVFTSRKAFIETGIDDYDIKYITMFNCLKKTGSDSETGTSSYKFTKDPNLIGMVENNEDTYLFLPAKKEEVNENLIPLF